MNKFDCGRGRSAKTTATTVATGMQYAAKTFTGAITKSRMNELTTNNIKARRKARTGPRRATRPPKPRAWSDDKSGKAFAMWAATPVQMKTAIAQSAGG